MKSNSKAARKAGLRAALWCGGLAAAALAVLGTALVGCQQSVPPSSAMALTPCPTPLSFNGFESLADNGALNPPTSGVTYTSLLSLSNFFVTQGNHSLDVDVTTAAAYNQNMLIFTGFSPAVWNGVAALTMDLTVDPSVLAGASYHQLLLVADTSSVRGSNPYGTFFQSITGSSPNLVAGSQSVTFNIDFSQGLILPADPLTKLTLVYNNNAAGNTGGTENGTGNIYVDNIQLIQKCP